MEAFGQQQYTLRSLAMLCYASTHYTSLEGFHGRWRLDWHGYGEECTSRNPYCEFHSPSNMRARTVLLISVPFECAWGVAWACHLPLMRAYWVLQNQVGRHNISWICCLLSYLVLQNKTFEKPALCVRTR